MKISIIIPVYYNEDNLRPLYDDIKKKVIDAIDYEYELVLVNDGSRDNSYNIMKELTAKDEHIKIISLSRNFGSHAAILCGLTKCTGDLMWYWQSGRGVRKVKGRLYLQICIMP